jgi:xanthine dehydrogenase accessory factor
MDKVWQEALKLENAREPFAVVSVVRSVKPTSARVGAKALVLADGQMIGFVGGQCTRPQVVAQALECIRTGENRLLLMTSDPAQVYAKEGLTVLPMTCHSEGTVELFIEAKLPPPVLLVIGDSPVARHLTDMASHLDFCVKSLAASEIAADGVSSPERLTEAIRQRLSPGAYVVVATMGQYDEESLSAIQESEPAYVGLVASPKRRLSVLDGLKEQGVSDAFLAAVSAPVGLDLGAVEPAEIAVTILAEIIQLRRGKKHTFAAKAASSSAGGGMNRDSDHHAALSGGADGAAVNRSEAVDPVCGMAVDLNTTIHQAVYQGQTYGFCCPHCRRAFLKEPERYLQKQHA